MYVYAMPIKKKRSFCIFKIYFLKFREPQSSTYWRSHFVERKLGNFWKILKILFILLALRRLIIFELSGNILKHFSCYFVSFQSLSVVLLSFLFFRRFLKAFRKWLHSFIPSDSISSFREQYKYFIFFLYIRGNR